MRLLLDTHVVLWLVAALRSRLPETVVGELEDQRNEVLLSAASVWEIAIKRSRGKLEAEDGWPRALTRLGLTATPITAEHAAAVEALPWVHRDPFDRMLVAQAKVERATLVTADARLGRYDVPILWD